MHRKNYTYDIVQNLSFPQRIPERVEEVILEELQTVCCCTYSLTLFEDWNSYKTINNARQASSIFLHRATSNNSPQKFFTTSRVCKRHFHLEKSTCKILTDTYYINTPPENHILIAVHTVKDEKILRQYIAAYTAWISLTLSSPSSTELGRRRYDKNWGRLGSIKT